MFSHINLFHHVQCPDTHCSRLRCIFQHQVSQRQVDSRPDNRSLPPGTSRPVSAPSSNQPLASSSKPPPNNAPNIVAKPLESRPVTGRLVSAQARISNASPSLTSLSVPTLPTNLKISPQPLADRNKALALLFMQFDNLYQSISPEQPGLAAAAALAQESEISTSSSTLRAYKTAVHHAAASIMKRPKPTTPSHPSVGTVRESRVAYEAAAKAEASKLDRSRITPYLLQDFKMWDYPDLTDDALLHPTELKPNAEGTIQICSRCKVPFTVTPSPDGRDCRYHHGRCFPERIEGYRKWIYSCCRRERGEIGCEEGVHVFAEKEDTSLAERAPFEKATQSTGVGVAAMDCEMIYTTAGSSLGRVTIIDETGATLLDELVRQQAAVLDANTRFSGITVTELQHAVLDLPAVRTAACAFIGLDTILVGHGLENDLRALRLLHNKVIDTAILFPHDKGPPFRRALRDLVKEKLGIFIQDHTADLGHSSAIDAIAALDLVKWRVREDAP